jgi:mono/diheme cytochrome c family protein
MLRKNCALALLCIEAMIVGITDGLAADQNTEVRYPNIHASTNSSVLTRGRYLVMHVAVCGHCHSTSNGAPGPDGEVHLSGAVSGYVPNITPDLKTGIGALSDGTIARTLRYGVAHDGREVPMMNYAFTDEDLTAVVSYLRSTKPVEREVPRVEFTATGFIPPDKTVARSQPLKRSPRGISVENGRYLVESVGDCASCHTSSDMRTGRLGSPFGGGTSFPGEASALAPPNITRGGRLASWSEDDFVARFRAGLLIEASRMPWIAYQGMHEDDLRSIYQYLKSLPAAHTPDADSE